MRKRYKVINKARFYLFLISLFVVGVIGLSSLLSINKVYSVIYEYDYDEIQVVEGDTLWIIALDYISDGYDVREMVYNIKKVNEMDTSYIYPGDLLKIPLIE